MSLIERLHNAEQEGRERFSRALSNLEETQSRLRRRMRVHPRAGKSVKVAVSSPARPIVTINGRDVPPQDLPTHELQKEEHVA